MNTDDAHERSNTLSRETDDYIRANPLPSVLAAVGIGFALGMAARLLMPERKHEPLHDALDDLRELLSVSAKRGKRVYADSAGAVREAVEHAVEKARDLEVDPLAKWWKRLWS